MHRAELFAIGGKAGDVVAGQHLRHRAGLLFLLRLDPAQLAALPVVAPNGTVVPLSSVARIAVSEGPNQISRNNGSRRIVVQANVRGRDLGGFVQEAQAAVADVSLPSGVYLDWGGQFENLQRAEQRLLLVIPIVFLLIGVVKKNAILMIDLALELERDQEMRLAATTEPMPKKAPWQSAVTTRATISSS